MTDNGKALNVFYILQDSSGVTTVIKVINTSTYKNLFEKSTSLLRQLSIKRTQGNMSSLIFTSRSCGRKLMSSTIIKRTFCYPTTIEVTPEMRRRNTITAVTLLVSVGIVYYSAMAAMKEEAEDISAAMKLEPITTVVEK